MKEGLFVEPASAASVAGILKLNKTGYFKNTKSPKIVCILTGHPLKDPDATVGYHTGKFKPGKKVKGKRTFANLPVQVVDDLGKICQVIENG